MENTPKIDVEDTTEEKKVLPTFQTWSPRDSARVESPVKTPNKRNSLIIGIYLFRHVVRFTKTEQDNVCYLLVLKNQWNYRKM